MKNYDAELLEACTAVKQLVERACKISRGSARCKYIVCEYCNSRINRICLLTYNKHYGVNSTSLNNCAMAAMFDVVKTGSTPEHNAVLDYLDKAMSCPVCEHTLLTGEQREEIENNIGHIYEQAKRAYEAKYAD